MDRQTHQPNQTHKREEGEIENKINDKNAITIRMINLLFLLYRSYR
jgi:hypothetical protein